MSHDAKVVQVDPFTALRLIGITWAALLIHPKTRRPAARASTIGARAAWPIIRWGSSRIIWPIVTSTAAGAARGVKAAGSNVVNAVWVSSRTAGTRGVSWIIAGSPYKGAGFGLLGGVLVIGLIALEFERMARTTETLAYLDTGITRRMTQKIALQSDWEDSLLSGGGIL